MGIWEGFVNGDLCVRSLEYECVVELKMTFFFFNLKNNSSSVTKVGFQLGYNPPSN